MNPDNPNFRTPGVQKIIDNLMSDNRKLLKKLEYKTNEVDVAYKRCADAESIAYDRAIARFENEIKTLKEQVAELEEYKFRYKSCSK